MTRGENAGKGKSIGPTWPRPIPNDWAVVRLKHLAKLYAGGTPDRENQSYWEGGTIPWLSSGEVNQWTITSASALITEEGFRNSSAKWIPKDALVMALAGQGKTKGMVAQLALEATCNQSMAAIVIERTVNARYLLWWLFANYETIRNLAGGEQRDGLNLEIVGNIPCPLPSRPQQDAIVDFLDRETGAIDALVSAKGRVLALIAEKKQALTSQTSIRGTDADAGLRDPKVDWLGKIPADWNLSRVAWLFRERDERGNPELPLLEVSINSGVVLREFSNDRIENVAADFNSYKIARKGDIVFNKMRMWQGAVGVAPQDGLVSPDYTVAAITGSLSSEYAGLLFRTPAFSAECARHSHGIVWDRLRLYWEGFREIVVPVPPPGAQAEIVARVNAEISELDALRVATEKSIALLRERRAALISAAVTGQVDVVKAA